MIFEVGNCKSDEEAIGFSLSLNIENSLQFSIQKGKEKIVSVGGITSLRVRGSSYFFQLIHKPIDFVERSGL